MVGSPCSPRDSQESSPTPQFKSINSLALSFLFSPTLTSIHDYWKNHSFELYDSLCYIPETNIIFKPTILQYLWRIHFDIWQNQYNIVKFKNKIKFLKKRMKKKKTEHIASSRNGINDRCWLDPWHSELSSDSL